jgi:hypothetical protein
VLWLRGFNWVDLSPYGARVSVERRYGGILQIVKQLKGAVFTPTVRALELRQAVNFVGGQQISDRKGRGGIWIGMTPRPFT